MNKKYFFFDIDGTLTNQATHKIVPSAAHAVQELEKNGHFVAIATGRALYKTTPFTSPLHLDNIVCFGGGCLVKDGKVVMMKPLELKKTVHFLEKADQDGLGWLLMLENTDDVYCKDFRFLEQAGRRKELTTYHYDAKMDYSRLKQILKVYLAVPKGEEGKYPWLIEMGYLRLNDSYVVIQYDQKDQGIRAMMEYLGADTKDVVVFGDDTNDLVMFQKEWLAIAMGNANEQLKEKADYITAKNIDDGIWKACRHFGWI